MHLRDYPGFEETSRKILMLKPGLMTNWVTLAAACYVNRNYQGCIQAVESILKFQEETAEKNKLKPYESNEIILLAVRAYEAHGKFQEALAFITKNKKLIVDTVQLNDHLGLINHKLGNTEASVTAYENLLQLNSANLDTYKKIITAKGVDLPSNSQKPLSEAY